MSTHSVEKDGSLSQNVPRLDQLHEPVAQQLVTVVHLDQPLLMFRKLDIQLIHGLRSTGSNGNQWGGVVKRSDWDCVLLPLNLSSEESNAASHVVYAANFGNKRTLEGVYMRVQLQLWFRYDNGRECGGELRL